MIVIGMKSNFSQEVYRLNPVLRVAKHFKTKLY